MEPAKSVLQESDVDGAWRVPQPHAPVGPRGASVRVTGIPACGTIGRRAVEASETVTMMLAAVSLSLPVRLCQGVGVPPSPTVTTSTIPR